MKIVFRIAVSLLTLSILGIAPEAMEHPLRAAQAAGPSSEKSPSMAQAENGASKIDPAKLAAFRGEYEALIAEYYDENTVRQDYLLTRAIKI